MSNHKDTALPLQYDQPLSSLPLIRGTLQWKIYVIPIRTVNLSKVPVSSNIKKLHAPKEFVEYCLVTFQRFQIGRLPGCLAAEYSLPSDQVD